MSVAVKKSLTIQEAARELGVSDRHVRELIAEGLLEAYDISVTNRRPHLPRSIRISVPSLEKFRGQRRIESP